MSREPATGDEVLGALERTLGAGSARVAFRFQISMDDVFASESGSVAPRGGSVGRRVMGRVGPVVSRMFVRGTGQLINRLSRAGEVGIIDFQAHRCVYDVGRSKVEMIIGDRRWSGAPGTSLEECCAGAASSVQPLWLVDLLRGVVDAKEQGAQHLHGRRVRCFSAHADLNRAADAVSYEMAVPPETEQLVDLTQIAVEVCVDDDGYIRRIRHASGGPGKPMSTSTLDLTELGTALPSDWSRIPALTTGHPGP